MKGVGTDIGTIHFIGIGGIACCNRIGLGDRRCGKDRGTKARDH